MQIATFLLFVCLISINIIGKGQETNGTTFKWGNATYNDLSVGESVRYLGKSVKLVSIENNWCLVEVDGVQKDIMVARRTLPTVVNGIRVFVSDNKNVKELTSDIAFPRAHDALSKDALLCLSDPAKPLVDRDKFTFPIDRSDGFNWNKSENSHMWAYLSPIRSHEGLDLNMHEARGGKIHSIVAIEDGIVRWKADGEAHQSCLFIESKSAKGVYYIYQHLNRESVSLKSGDHVKKGQFLAHIWGDGRWGHLHFAIKGSEGVVNYGQRYTELINFFPQLYELWHGDLQPHTPVRTVSHFHFAKQYWLYGNSQCLNGYDNIIGYGWDLGKWCTSWTVEASLANNKPDQSAILRKTLHLESGRPAKNPKDYFDFEVAVANADYQVRIKVGNMYGPTWQKVEFEGIDAGTFELETGEVKWTDEKRVSVVDGKLTIRFYLKDEVTEAGCYELYFVMAS